LTPFVDEINVDAYGTAYGIIKSVADPLRVVIRSAFVEMLMGIISNRWFVACQSMVVQIITIAASKVVSEHMKGEYHRELLRGSAYKGTSIQQPDRVTNCGD
jgi:hypothetical protein